METELIKSVVDLGGTVTVVGAFLWYLRDRNGRQEKAMHEVAVAQNKTTDVLDRNTRVLIKVAQKHNLLNDVDELIEK